jgi:hypothetical protein
MRQWMLGLLGLAAVALLLMEGRVEPHQAWAGQVVPPSISGAGLVTHVQVSDGQPTRVIVIDPQQKVMGVYDVSRDKGEIQLKSVRSLGPDMQMLEFNSGSPSPADIQKLLQRSN